MTRQAVDVVFALRADAGLKPGGDTSKIERYRAFLAYAGITSRTVYSPQELADIAPGILHIVNVDVPIENLRYVASLRKSGTKIALSTIAHPLDGLRKFYYNSGDAYHAAARRLGITFDIGLMSREMLKLSLRQRKLPNLSGVAHCPLGFRTLQQKLVASCDLLLPMNAAEESELESRFIDRPPMAVVPNGTTFSFGRSPEATERNIDVVVVGRVEPRKNALELAKALKGTGFRTAFLGAPNANHNKYVARFSRVVDSDPDLLWLGRQTSRQVRAILERSNVYVNPSWYEVVSQADIEAASQGCRVVTTMHSFLAEHLHVEKLIDPIDVADSRRALAILDGIVNASVPQPKWLPTWEDAGEALLAAYKTLL